MTPHPALATAAAFERDARIRHYPAEIAAGRMTREDADIDIAAWTAVADFMATGVRRGDVTWSQLGLATTRALIRREEDAAAHPGHAGKASRRDMVDAIDERVRHTRDHYADLNARFRGAAASIANSG